MSDANSNTPQVVQRVVEIDDKRVNHIQGLVEDLKEMLLGVRESSIRRDEAIKRLEDGQKKTDEMIRGNGKAGLNTQVTLLQDQMESTQSIINNLPSVIEKKIEDTALLMNTGKVRAVVKEELEKQGTSPGSWGEFRAKWLIPLAVFLATTIFSKLLDKVIIP